MKPRRNRTCWKCKCPVLMKDVGEERTRWPGTVQEYLCKTCQRERVDALVAKTRKELGLGRNP